MIHFALLVFQRPWFWPFLTILRTNNNGVKFVFFWFSDLKSMKWLCPKMCQSWPLTGFCKFGRKVNMTQSMQQTHNFPGLYSVSHNFIAPSKELCSKNHEGARHCRKPLGRRKGLNIFFTKGFTKIRAFVWCGQIFYYTYCRNNQK